jgi:DNA-binding CsgD family transcriptional regulator
MGVAEVTRARDRLRAVDRDEGTVQEVCAAILRALHDVALFDASAVMTTDPVTLLPSGGVVEGFEPGDCAPFWDNELVDPDFNKFAQIAKGGDPVVSLSDAVDGDLWRSPRYQKLYAGVDASDELRIAFMAGASCLAVGVMVRPAGVGPFTPAEQADVRSLVPTATGPLRRALGRLEREVGGRPPVLVLLDAAGRVTTTTQGGTELLEELRTSPDDDVPSIIRAAATKARWSRNSTTVTTRVRDGSGRWLRLHIAPVEGEVGAVAVMIDTARPDDIVPILLESYGLTQREIDVVLLVARGLPAREIAAELSLSTHTVRGHIKSIFEKAGVSSRGELVAMLFSNHVLDRFHASVAHLTHAGHIDPVAPAARSHTSPIDPGSDPTALSGPRR